ncbi:MAG: hypothetical protein ACQERD_11505 [Campylobacterota bacterium]
MKIEFRKVPFNTSDFKSSLDSVKIEGTFCKITPTLVKVNAQLNGNTQINCCRCGNEEDLTLKENENFLLSDGVFTQNETDDLVIEIYNGIIDFDEIIKSEVESIKSDYHLCSDCLKDNSELQKEF